MIRPTPNQLAEHEQIAEITSEWIAAGNEITVIPPRLSLMGYNHEDWKRIARGLIVATKAQIAAERERRLLRAITRNDIDLVTDLAGGKYDKQIKIDIEGKRIDPETGAWLGLRGKAVA